MPYPDRLEDVERLIEQHKNIAHQTLLLAVYYDLGDGSDNVCLLEVISPFGYDEVSEDKHLFEMQYGSTQGFPLSPKCCLSILLTNAPEARKAIAQEWAGIIPVLDAVSRNKYKVLYKAGEGNTVLKELRDSERKLVAA